MSQTSKTSSVPDYDSTDETLEHISRVQHFVGRALHNLGSPTIRS